MTVPTEFPQWPDLIAEMCLLRRRVNEVDADYEWTVPHAPATPEQLDAAERRLGFPLDPQHRAFLGSGDGWPGFYLDNTLLSAEQIGEGFAWDALTEALDAFYGELGDPSAVPPKEEIYPITFDQGGGSIFAIWTQGPIVNGGHPVLWLPWPDTEPYDNFFDFYRMVYQEYLAELPS
ncbi:SMI1/KNR4 family protein [Lentzea sp.]|uniref:SMI1/KNR4 family protein n=1 Tax=Lentzea sp. TaxID=56099 RepID=UPI002ED59A45